MNHPVPTAFFGSSFPSLSCLNKRLKNPDSFVSLEDSDFVLVDLVALFY